MHNLKVINTFSFFPIRECGYVSSAETGRRKLIIFSLATFSDGNEPLSL